MACTATVALLVHLGSRKLTPRHISKLPNRCSSRGPSPHTQLPHAHPVSPNSGTQQLLFFFLFALRLFHAYALVAPELECSCLSPGNDVSPRPHLPPSVYLRPHTCCLHPQANAMSSYIDWSKTTKSKDYRGSSSFATFLIIGRMSPCHSIACAYWWL